MINFPIIEELEVAGYALYQKDPTTPGFSAAMGLGPWIVLGVNGLGKSTLLLMLRALLLGRTRVAPAGFSGRRESGDVMYDNGRMFAARVMDQARGASATVTVSIGRKTLSVTRSLSDLSLLECSTSHRASQVSDERAYQDLLCDLIGIGDFANVIRLLDRCVFYLEDRAPLVWDVAAQYDIFRAVFASNDVAQELRLSEADIVSADSSARNLHATLTGIQKRRNKELEKLTSAADVAVQITSLSAQLDNNLTTSEKLQQELDVVIERRLDQRTVFLRAQLEVDEFAANYEKLKLQTLREALKPLTKNEQYTFLKIVSEKICPACGSNAEATAEVLNQRHESHQCLVCGSEIGEHPQTANTESISGPLLELTYEKYVTARKNLAIYRDQLDDAVKEQEKLELRQGALISEKDALETKIRKLRAKLPATDQASIHRGLQQIEALREEVNHFRKERQLAERRLIEALSSLSRAVEKNASKITSRFMSYATVFFSDHVRLVYSPRQQRVGQSSDPIPFPAFEVEMIGTATEGQFARRTSNQVSLSQNFYLDLSFRMAVIDVVGSHGGAILVDGAETSVDAVFAELGGKLLSQFASASNQVIAACNVVEGAFLPNLLRKFRTKDTRMARTINLLDISAPTPALESQRSKYRKAISEIFSQKAN